MFTLVYLPHDFSPLSPSVENLGQNMDLEEAATLAAEETVARNPQLVREFVDHSSQRWNPQNQGELVEWIGMKYGATPVGFGQFYSELLRFDNFANELGSFIFVNSDHARSTHYNRNTPL